MSGSNPTCRWAAACRRAPRSRSACCARCARLSALPLDDVELARIGAARRDRVRRRAGRHHGSDGVQPRRPGEALFLDTRTLAYRAGAASAGAELVVIDSGRDASARRRRVRAPAGVNRSRRRRCSACAYLRDVDRRCARRDQRAARPCWRGAPATSSPRTACARHRGGAARRRSAARRARCSTRRTRRCAMTTRCRPPKSTRSSTLGPVANPTSTARG